MCYIVRIIITNTMKNRETATLFRLYNRIIQPAVSLSDICIIILGAIQLEFQLNDGIYTRFTL